jgi:hypothetical protein
MKVDPQTEHRWLQQLSGEWVYESQCSMGPDQPPTTMKGREITRMLGDLWMIGEGQMDMPDGTKGQSIITVGYDPKHQSFVGSWVGSMMTHLWIYRGSLDLTGKILTLNSEGPSFSGDGTTAKYQDIITIVSKNHRIFSGRVQAEDGTWNEFMTSDYRRTA